MTGEPVIERIASVGSTNAELAGRLRGSNLPVEGYWLVADRQTAGRGRLGRDWQDGAGNFMGSTVVFPGPEDPPAHTLALVAGIAVHGAVRRALGADEVLQLKWPNDLLLDGAKLAGILLEKFDQAVVVGIGVNLVSAPEVPGRKVASLLSKGVRTYRDVFAFHLAIELAQVVARWREEGLSRIVSDWMTNGPEIGTRLRTTLSESEALDGAYDGLNEDGSLRIRLDDGSMRAIHAGEVSLPDIE